MPLTVSDVKVGDTIQWDAIKPPVTARIDKIDHNGEIVWATMLDGEHVGSHGPIFLDECSKFVIQGT